MKTKLGRRFVYNSEKNESFWKFPTDVMKGVIEYDRSEREKRELLERRKDVDNNDEDQALAEQVAEPEAHEIEQHPPGVPRRPSAVGEDSDEYEEVEVTDEDEDEKDEEEQNNGHSPKRLKTDPSAPDGPVEFNEDDIAYQLAAMGQEYGLDPGEYGEEGDEEWEEGAEGLPLTVEDSEALFKDLLEDFHINPYTTWEHVMEEGRVVDDDRYVALSNMKTRREVYGIWSRDKIQALKEQRAKEERKDPRIPYLALLDKYATPKLYWPEFKRKFKKEPELRDSKLLDKDREKLYREHINRLKLPESTRKSDFAILLRSVPLALLNRSSSVTALPTPILADLRYISLPSSQRDPLVEAYISTLPAAPENVELSTDDAQERDKKRADRERRERALAEREKMVQMEKSKSDFALRRGRGMLREEEAEIQRAMRVGKSGLKSYMMPADDEAHNGD